MLWPSKGYLVRAFLASLFLWFTTAALAADSQTLGNILFWTPAQQESGYRTIDRIYPTRKISHGAKVYPLPKGKSLDVSYDVQGETWNTDRFMAANKVSGLLVVKDGKIVLERYGLGRTQKDPWVSFSVSKSVTSTLLGAAIADGTIKSLDAPVTDYIPALKGSAYDGVTVRQLLTMTSGVKWNEDYSDPKSDAALFAAAKPGPGTENPIVTYMAKLPREAPPGTKFSYKTGESDLVGILVENATGKRLADYLSEKIWSRFGMGSDANWMLDQAGHEIGGCCISMTLRDYARFGLFIMGGGKAGGVQIVPPDYLAEATKKQVQSDFGPLGYGYQWWIPQGGGYEAIGVFGQSITINPAENLVVVINSAWPVAGAQKYYLAAALFTEAVTKALHKG
jgi:CubicO group peptidase (beta-lactamase class C family)